MFLRQYLSYLTGSRIEDSGANPNASGQKTYHKKATGTALSTVKRHSKEHEFKLYGSCFW